MDNVNLRQLIIEAPTPESVCTEEAKNELWESMADMLHLTKRNTGEHVFYTGKCPFCEDITALGILPEENYIKCLACGFYALSIKEATLAIGDKLFGCSNEANDDDDSNDCPFGC